MVRVLYWMGKSENESIFRSSYFKFVVLSDYDNDRFSYATPFLLECV